MLFAYKPCFLSQDTNHSSHVKWNITSYPIYQTVHAQRGELVLDTNDHQYFSRITITLVPYPSGDDLSITFQGDFDFNQACKKLNYYSLAVNTERKELNVKISKNEKKMHRLFKEIDKIIPLQMEINMLKTIFFYINETCFLQSFATFSQSLGLRQRKNYAYNKLLWYVSAFTKLS